MSTQRLAQFDRRVVAKLVATAACGGPRRVKLTGKVNPVNPGDEPRDQRRKTGDEDDAGLERQPHDHGRGRVRYRPRADDGDVPRRRDADLGPDGKYQGSVFDYGRTQMYTDRSRHFTGSAVNNGNGTTSFYGRNGNFTGSAGSSIDRAFNFGRSR